LGENYGEAGTIEIIGKSMDYQIQFVTEVLALGNWENKDKFVLALVMKGSHRRVLQIIN
jgi:hypothetical protein